MASVNVGSASVTIVPTMSGFSKGVQQAFGSAGTAAGTSFSRTATGGISGVAKAFSSSGRASGTGFSSGLATAEVSVGGFSGRVAAAFGAAMGVAQSVTSKAFDAIASSIDSAVARVDTMNNFPRVLAGLGYSADDASAAVAKMGDHLTGLPTKLDAMTSSVQKIVPTVKDVGRSTDIMLAFNDALLAGGASTQVQEAALEQFTQVLAKGKPELEDWRSIQQAMPGQLDQVAKSLLGQAASSNDLYEAMKAGKVTVEQLEDAFVSLDTEGYAGFDSFAEQAKNGTAGIATSMSNLQNSVTKATAACIQAIGVENITAPVQAATKLIKTAGDDVAGAIQTAREWVGRFMDACQENGAAQALSDILGTLVDTGGSVADAVGRVWGQLTGWLPDLADSGTAADTLKGALDALRGILEPLCGAVSAIADNFEALEPAIAAAAGAYAGFKVATGITDAARKLGDLKGAAELAFEGIGKGEGVLKSVADAASALPESGIAGTLGSIAGKLGDLKGAAASAGGGITGLSKALGMGPWGLVATAIAAVVAGLVWFFTQTEAGRELWSRFTTFLGECWQTISSAASEVWGSVCRFFSEDVPNAIRSAVQWFQSLPESIAGALSSAISAVGQWVSDLAQKALEVGTSFVQAVIDFFTSLPTNIAVGLGLVIGAVAGLVVALAESAVQVGSQFVDAVVTFFSELPGRVAEFLTTCVTNVGTWVAETAQKATEAGTQFLQNVTTFFQELPGRVWGFLASAASSIASWASDTASKATQAGSDFISNVMRFFQTLPQRIEWQLRNAVNFVIAFATSVAKKAVEAGQGFLVGVRGGFESAVSFIGGIPGRVMGLFSDAGSWLLDSGRSLISGFTEGIRRGFESAKSAVSSGLSTLRSFFPFSPAKRGPFSGHGYTTYSGRALMGGLGEGIAAGTRSAVAQARASLAAVSDAMASGGGASWAAQDAVVAPAAAGTAASAPAGSTYNLYIDGSSSRMDARMVSLVEEIVGHAELVGAM